MDTGRITNDTGDPQGRQGMRVYKSSTRNGEFTIEMSTHETALVLGALATMTIPDKSLAGKRDEMMMSITDALLQKTHQDGQEMASTPSEAANHRDDSGCQHIVHDPQCVPPGYDGRCLKCGMPVY